jgi:hypothetical protein
MYRQTGRHVDRQADRQTGNQVDRLAGGRQTADEKQIGRRQTHWQVTDSWQAAEQRRQASEQAGGQRDRQADTHKDMRITG